MHSFRHTVASRALLAGESIDETAFLLGHRDANVTRAVYVREVSDAPAGGRCGDRGWSPSSRTFSTTTTSTEPQVPDRRGRVSSALATIVVSWPPEIGELLPNVLDAYNVREKLADYSLNLEHARGGEKADGVRSGSGDQRGGSGLPGRRVAQRGADDPDLRGSEARQTRRALPGDRARAWSRRSRRPSGAPCSPPGRSDATATRRG